MKLSSPTLTTWSAQRPLILRDEDEKNRVFWTDTHGLVFSWDQRCRVAPRFCRSCNAGDRSSRRPGPARRWGPRRCPPRWSAGRPAAWGNWWGRRSPPPRARRPPANPAASPPARGRGTGAAAPLFASQTASRRRPAACSRNRSAALAHNTL